MNTVLIIDDDTRLLQAMGIALELQGYRVLQAQDAYQGLATACREHPDALVIDVNLPAGDGFSIQSRLRTTTGWHIPVIYMTGDSSETVKQTALRVGAHEVLQKPFHSSELCVLLKEAIEYADSVSMPPAIETHG